MGYLGKIRPIFLGLNGGANLVSKYLKELNIDKDSRFYKPTKGKYYKQTNINYSDVWDYQSTLLADIYCHLRYFQDYTIVMLDSEYDKETGKESKPNMIKYDNVEYKLGDLIRIELDKIKVFFDKDPMDFIHYKHKLTKGHEKEPMSLIDLDEMSKKDKKKYKDLFKSDDDTSYISNPNSYVIDKTDHVGLFKYNQYVGDIWDIWKILAPAIWE